MLGKDIAGALGGISEDKLMDAMNVYERKDRRRSMWLRAAAVAATVAILLTALLWPRQDENGIVTAPGVLKVYAYDLTEATELSEEIKFELVEGIEEYQNNWSMGINIIPGLPLTFSIPEEQYEGKVITLDIQVSGGEFFRELSDTYGNYHFGPAYLGQHFVLENNQTIYWWNQETDMDNWTETYDEEKIAEALIAGTEGEECNYVLPEIKPYLGGTAYIDIIIRADDDIVGCMLVKICPEDDSYEVGSTEYMGSWYHAENVKSVCFPSVDGKPQEISVSAVTELMESWK